VSPLVLFDSSGLVSAPVIYRCVSWEIKCGMLLLLLFVQTQRTVFVSARNRSAQTYKRKSHTESHEAIGPVTSG